MKQVEFLKSASKMSELPKDEGIEMAFLGRSNVGKSSVLNTLCQRKGLARVSKTPGRTRLFNLFRIDENERLVDLPGYGYAQVNIAMKAQWFREINLYLSKRQSLKAIVLIMDIRHPLKPFDEQIIEWSKARHLPALVLLNKSDKLNNHQANQSYLEVQGALKDHHAVELIIFSALKRRGVEEATRWLKSCFNI